MSTPADPSLSPRVLVVEDEAKTRDSLAEGLGLEGWRVAVAGGGTEALA